MAISERRASGFMNESFSALQFVHQLAWTCLDDDFLSSSPPLDLGAGFLQPRMPHGGLPGADSGWASSPCLGSAFR